MTKIQSGAGDGQWPKAPATEKSTHPSPTQSVPAAQAALRAEVTRFIESASPVTSVVYSEALLQKQEKAAESAVTQAEHAPPRTLADLPYLAHPEWLARKKGASSAPFDKPVARPMSKSPASNKEVRVPPLWPNGWWFLLIIAIVVFLLTLNWA